MLPLRTFLGKSGKSRQETRDKETVGRCESGKVLEVVGYSLFVKANNEKRITKD
jgi:hypothetical protein